MWWKREEEEEEMQADMGFPSENRHGESGGICEKDTWEK